MKQRLFNLSITLMFSLSAGTLWANEEHSHHEHTPKAYDTSSHEVSKNSLQKLDEVPASGKARENGFDGRPQMEATGIENSLATKCAQASRGLIMLSNHEWKQCGGKVKGIPEGPLKKTKSMDHGSQHSGHNE